MSFTGPDRGPRRGNNGQRRNNNGGFPERVRGSQAGVPAANEDSQKLRQAIQRIQGLSAEVEKEARLLRTPNFNAAQSKSKVQRAKQSAADVLEEAETLLKEYDVSGNGLSREEQDHRKAQHGKLSEDLRESWKDLQAALNQYDKAETDRAGAQAAADAGGSFTDIGPRARSSSNRIELESRDEEAAQMEAGRQAAQAIDVTRSDVDVHGEIVQSITDDARRLAAEARDVQRLMVDIRLLEQDQEKGIDSIESEIHQAADTTTEANQELLVTSRDVRRKGKIYCWILLIAVILALVLIIVIATRK